MRVKSAGFILLLLTVVSGCGPDPRRVQTTPEQIAPARLISSEERITDFGWLPDGRIYYAIGGSPEAENLIDAVDTPQPTWFAIDLADGRPVEIAPLTHALDDRQWQSLGGDRVGGVMISPSGRRAIFTYLPDEYQGTPDVDMHYFDAFEIWAADFVSTQKIITIPILNGTGWHQSCGLYLWSEGWWYEDESLAVGRCLHEMGARREYFFANLDSQTIQFLRFRTARGEDIPIVDIAAANQHPRLAFYAMDRFWLASREKASGEFDLTLSGEDILFDDRSAVRPAWSADDKWIYYWVFGGQTEDDERDSVAYRPWRLERVDPLTREQEVVLSEAELRISMGPEQYDSTYRDFISWRLSADQSQMLLHRDSVNDFPAALFLITF